MEEVLHVLAVLHCNNTRKLPPMLVNVYSRKHLDVLFLVTSRILMSIGRVSGVACPLLFIRPWLYKHARLDAPSPSFAPGAIAMSVR